MKKILIAFLMSIISLGSITPPTFADGCQADDDNCKKIPTSDEIYALQAQVDTSRANERTLEHLINDAVGIGGVGFGGMMIGGALSENATDDDIESDMRAYINTFRCDYGDGNTVRGGQTNVEIPGGNELIDLYARYARLANDLKLRKESLGIKPGIESEVIIDKASTGLYDDVGTGVVGGGYASIARAIMNPNGPDAAMWAAQRAATTSKLNTGIGIATTAAALTLGNSIREALKKPVEDLQQAIKEIPPKQCSEFTGTTNEGNVNTPCTCTNKNERFFYDQDGCIPCGTGKEYNEHNSCVCQGDNMVQDQNGNCVAINTNKCALSGENITLNNDGTCSCNTNAIKNANGTCTKCNYGVNEQKTACNPEPEKPKPGEEIIKMNLDANVLFGSGKYELTDKAKTILAKFSADAFQSAQGKNVNLTDSNNYCLIIIGHTDRQKYKNDQNNSKNLKLSRNRANAVKNSLKYFDQSATKTYGVADRDCNTKDYPKDNDPKCRKVEMIILAGACQETIDYSNSTQRGNASLVRETITPQ